MYMYKYIYIYIEREREREENLNEFAQQKHKTTSKVGNFYNTSRRF